jgi:hypothetical protein
MAVASGNKSWKIHRDAINTLNRTYQDIQQVTTRSNKTVKRDDLAFLLQKPTDVAKFSEIENRNGKGISTMKKKYALFPGCLMPPGNAPTTLNRKHFRC